MSMFIAPHIDDIPKLSPEQEKMPWLTIKTRGWVFKYNYGCLIICYPG